MLMGAVFFLAPPTVPQAQAQTDVEVWSKTLTVGTVLTTVSTGTLSTGTLGCNACSPFADFVITLEGLRYDIQFIILDTMGELRVEFRQGGTEEAFRTSTFHVGGTKFAFSNASVSGRTHTWASGLRWTLNQRVSLKVTQPGPNAAPTATNNTVMTNEDTAVTFSAGDFNFADTDTGDALASVTIVTIPTAGELTLDGTAVAAGSSVEVGKIGALAFKPAANANGMGYASFTFTVSDGEDASTPANTMTIDVTPVNDAATGEPTISGTAQVGQTLTADTSGIMDADGARYVDVPVGPGERDR